MIDWNKPLEGSVGQTAAIVHVPEIRCEVSWLHCCKYVFDKHDVVIYVDDDGYQCERVGRRESFSPIVRNVPPQLVTVPLFINYYPDNGTSFIYGSESAAQTHANRTSKGAVIAHPVEIKYTPE